MCGRYATARGAADLSDLFDAVDETAGTLAPTYNVAPTDPVPIIIRPLEPAGSVLVGARWGLVPPWAADPRVGARMINARVETVATSRVFGPALARRRCLVPADGWYEWVRSPGRRPRPRYLTRADGGVLAFAGLWSRWRDRLSCTIITTEAVGPLTEVHHRMPIVLREEFWSSWLGTDSSPVNTTDLLAASVDDLPTIEIRPVGNAVGDVRNDGPDLIARVADDSPAPDDVTPTLF